MGKLAAFGLSLVAGMIVTLVAIGVAALLGGPIAAALAAFNGVAALLVATIMSAALSLLLRDQSRRTYLLWGAGIYMASLALVLLWWGVAGPSQIM